MTYGETAHDLHAALRSAGVTVDVVPPGTDLDGYKIVVVPTLYLCTDETARSVAAACEAGAHVVVTFFSGIVDEHDHVRLGGYPGAFMELLGVRSEEFYPMPAGQAARLDDGLVAGARASRWSELLACTTAEAVTRFIDGPLPGIPAVTRREVGTAAAWYVATRLDEAATEALVRRVVDEAGVKPAAAAPPGVEVVRRVGSERSWLFVLNHSNEEVVIEVSGWDLVTEQQVGPLTLAAGRSAVVREG